MMQIEFTPIIYIKLYTVYTPMNAFGRALIMISGIRAAQAIVLVMTALLCTGLSHAGETEDFRTCSQSMEITDVRFSSRAEVGIEVVFDDLGCTVIWRNIQCAIDQGMFDEVATARDFDDLSIIIMSNSYYVKTDKLITPIGFGIAAFKDKGSAKKFISQHGTGNLLSYWDLIKLELMPPEPPEEEEESGK